jgi:hypothetical protein
LKDITSKKIEIERVVKYRLGIMATMTETSMTMTMRRNNLYEKLKEEIKTTSRVIRPHGQPAITSNSAVRSIVNKKHYFLFGLKGYQRDHEGLFKIYVLYFKNIVIKIDIQQSHSSYSNYKEDKITTFELDSPLLLLNMNDVINIVLKDSIADGNKIDWNLDWLCYPTFAFPIVNERIDESSIVKTIRNQIRKLCEKNGSKKMQNQMEQQQKIMREQQSQMEQQQKIMREQQSQMNLIQSFILSMQNQLQEQSKLITSLECSLVETREEMRVKEEKSSQQCKLVTSLKDTREEKQVDMFADWLIDDIHKEETTKD